MIAAENSAQRPGEILRPLALFRNRYDSMNRTLLGAIVALALLAGCGPTDLEGGSQAGQQTHPPVTTVVDSAFPVDVMLERFRADLPGETTALDGGFETPDALVREMLDLLAAADTAGFERLAINRGEFAWLVYPASPMSRPPYELPPALMWFRAQQENRIGVLRMLRELGEREYPFFALRCPAEPASEGDNRMLGGCTVLLDEDGNEERRLFGTLVERDGRWKVLSFANDF